MAEDSNKEQLEIQAKLDTSQLKTEAKQAFNEVVKEEKKVEEQSKKTSKAIDDIGKAGKQTATELKTTEDAGNKVASSLQKAGQSGTQALKEVGKEAEKTAKKISSIDESVKGIKLGQAFGIANRLLHTQTAQNIGGEIGDALGMSDTSKDVAGGAISGALGGASMGAMIGSAIPGVGTAIGAGIGAAAGALAGAASALMDAAAETKDAARNLAKETGRESEATINRYNETKYREETAQRVQGYLDNPTTTPKLQEEIARLQADIEEGKQKRDELATDINTVSQWSSAGLSGSARIKADNERSAKLAELNDEYAKNEREMERTAERVNALTAALKMLEQATKPGAVSDNGMVGPEMPFYVKAQRDAEEKARQEAEKREAEFEKIKNANWQKEQRDLAASYRDEAKEKLSSISGMSGMKLTDSLTQIGGGAGYASQMRGITDHVQRVVNEVKKLNGIADSILNKMDNIKNEGVFTGDSE